MLKSASVLAVALLSMALAGCHGVPSADVVATVNKHPILRADLDKVYNDQLGESQQHETPSSEQADSLRLQLLHDLIDVEIIQQRAAKMGLTASNEEVDAKLAEMRAPYTDEQFAQHLAESHRTLEDVKRDLRRSITINKLLNKEINSKITVSDADIRDYFNHHKSEFNNMETQYHLAQILVTTSPASEATNLQGSKAQSDAEAKKKIQALKNRIDSGEDFGVLAMNFSEDSQTSSSGGDRGLIPESQLETNAPAFAAVSKLKPGQTTDILPIPDPHDPKHNVGYVILQLISKETAGQHDVSEPQVQQRIRQGLHDARSQLLKGAYFEMLRDQARIQNFFAEQIFKNDAR